MHGSAKFEYMGLAFAINLAVSNKNIAYCDPNNHF